MKPFNLPTYEKGKSPTLLETDQANVVSRFIRAFQNWQVVEGKENKIDISENNIVLTLKPSSGGGGGGIAPSVVWGSIADPSTAGSSDVGSAIKAAYGVTGIPKPGDIAVLMGSAAGYGTALHYAIFPQSSSSKTDSIFLVNFTLNGDWVAINIGPPKLL